MSLIREVSSPTPGTLKVILLLLLLLGSPSHPLFLSVDVPPPTSPPQLVFNMLLIVAILLVIASGCLAGLALLRLPPLLAHYRSLDDVVVVLDGLISKAKDPAWTQAMITTLTTFMSSLWRMALEKYQVIKPYVDQGGSKIYPVVKEWGMKALEKTPLREVRGILLYD